MNTTASTVTKPDAFAWTTVDPWTGRNMRTARADTMPNGWSAAGMLDKVLTDARNAVYAERARKRQARNSTVLRWAVIALAVVGLMLAAGLGVNAWLMASLGHVPAVAHLVHAHAGCLVFLRKC